MEALPSCFPKIVVIREGHSPPSSLPRSAMLIANVFENGRGWKGSLSAHGSIPRPAFVAARSTSLSDQRPGHRSQRRGHPNAQVTLTLTGQGTVFKATTNAVGEYSVPALDAGTYNLQVTAPGFEKFEANGIVLRVAHSERVDAKLAVGAVTAAGQRKRQRDRYRADRVSRDIVHHHRQADHPTGAQRP